MLCIENLDRNEWNCDKNTFLDCLWNESHNGGGRMFVAITSGFSQQFVIFVVVCVWFLCCERRTMGLGGGGGGKGIFFVSTKMCFFFSSSDYACGLIKWKAQYVSTNINVGNTFTVNNITQLMNACSSKF